MNGDIDIFLALQLPDASQRLRREKVLTVWSRPAKHTVNLVDVDVGTKAGLGRHLDRAL